VHSDFFSFVDDSTEGLILDKAIEQVCDPGSPVRGHLMNAEIWAAELSHTSRVEPLSAVLVFRYQNHDMVPRQR